MERLRNLIQEVELLQQRAVQDKDAPRLQELSTLKLLLLKDLNLSLEKENQMLAHRDRVLNLITRIFLVSASSAMLGFILGASLSFLVG